jgi:hypothetical protein
MSAAPSSDWSKADCVGDESFWRAHFPDLTIAGPSEDFLARPLGNEAAAQASRRIAVEGYFRARDDSLVDLAQPLSAAVAQLVEMKAPPVFVFLFDEAWTAFNRQTRMIGSLLGSDYRALPDFWAWHVDPKGGEAGWRPHRDGGRKTLAEDGSPLALTVWIPLTAATPETSCMYVLPADKDPTYGAEDEMTFKIDPPAVRALPAEPGEWLCWNQAVLHWGSQTSGFADQPRISMAVEFQRGDIPLLRKARLSTRPNLGFKTRLALIAAQILNYEHMYPLTADLRALALSLASAIA